MKNWEKINIKNDSGEIVEAIAPVIISASRSTDIPAFYSQWFFNRLKKEYVAWVNPFNRKLQYISFKNTRFIVFWTKNPKPILPYLKSLDKLGIHYYFQYTLNDYDTEDLEPNLPKIEERIKTFVELSKMIGKEKVIWRFDPLILSKTISVDLLLKRIESIGQAIKPYTDKLVFSFADIKCYNKVTKNLTSASNDFREFSEEEMKYFSEKLSVLNTSLRLDLATCAEKIELNNYGISHNRCVDDELIYKIGKDDDALVNWLGFNQPKELSLFDEIIYSTNNKLKDKGQRKECGCCISKDIGMYNTCNHLCRYCYANHSENIVKTNIAKHDKNKESLI